MIYITLIKRCNEKHKLISYQYFLLQLYNFYFLSLSVLAEAFIILLTDQSIDISIFDTSEGDFYQHLIKFKLNVFLGSILTP